MLYRSRALLPMEEGRAPIHDAALVVHGDTIVAVGPWQEVRAAFGGESVIDLGEQVVLPGLINAHCHLDYSSMRGAIQPKRTFTDWIGSINALKRELSDDDYLAAIAAGFRECAQHGTTTVLNFESFPELLLRMPPPPLRTWWFYEMIDLRGRNPTHAHVAGALSFFEEHPDWLGGFGLAPHAPYTASAELYRLTRECSLHFKMPWSTHLNESCDEWEMFTSARGPLHDFLTRLGRPTEDCGGGCTALESLTASGAMGSECLAVHMNTLSESDFALLSPGGPLHGLHVVHCPRSHRYFRHPAFPLGRLRAAGANLCVGTDSLASNGSLDLLGELRLLAATSTNEGDPLSARELLQMVTINPARALGKTACLGSLRVGAWADFIAIPDNDQHGDGLYLAVLNHQRPITCLHVAGRPVKADPSEAQN